MVVFWLIKSTVTSIVSKIKRALVWIVVLKLKEPCADPDGGGGGAGGPDPHPSGKSQKYRVF